MDTYTPRPHEPSRTRCVRAGGSLAAVPPARAHRGACRCVYEWRVYVCRRVYVWRVYVCRRVYVCWRVLGANAPSPAPRPPQITLFTYFPQLDLPHTVRLN